MFYYIGEEEVLIGLQYVGVSGAAVHDPAGALAAFNQVAAPHSPWKVLILSEQVSLWLGDTLTDWQMSGSYPLTVQLPGLSGHIPQAHSLVAQIREAIGIQV